MFPCSTPLHAATAVALARFSAVAARADAVTDWNAKTAGFIAEARLGTSPAIRVVALARDADVEVARTNAKLAAARVRQRAA